MNQITRIAPPVGGHNELLAGAIQHLRNAMETGSRRSCAVACMLFAYLGQDESLDNDLCEECKSLGECLEGLAQYGNWGSQP